MDVVAGVFLVVGAAFVLLAAIGVVRFHDTFSRMHAAAKAPALGLLCMTIGSALAIRSLEATVVVVLVTLFQLMSGTVGAHILGRSVYRRVRPDLRGIDELAEAEAEAAASAEPTLGDDPAR